MCSSAAEHETLNLMVAGSSPATCSTHTAQKETMRQTKGTQGDAADHEDVVGFLRIASCPTGWSYRFSEAMAKIPGGRFH